MKELKVGDKVRSYSGKEFTIEKIVNRRIFAKEILLHTDIDAVEKIEEFSRNK